VCHVFIIKISPSNSTTLIFKFQKWYSICLTDFENLFCVRNDNSIIVGSKNTRLIELQNIEIEAI
jgi:hypothetical protein